MPMEHLFGIVAIFHTARDGVSPKSGAQNRSEQGAGAAGLGATQPLPLVNFQECELSCEVFERERERHARLTLPTAP